MLFLLRKIRRKLLSKNKVTSYLLYAIGEIILVVIGILIAVNLNNWNNQRAVDQRAQNLLRQIKEEALQAAMSIDLINTTYTSYDSVYHMILADTLEKEDYLAPNSWSLRDFTYRMDPLTLQKEGYQTFLDQSDQFSDKYQKLVKSLKDKYLGYEFYLKDTEGEILKIMKGQYAFAKTKKWYPSLIELDSAYMDEFVEYLHADYRYRNEAMAFANGLYSTSATYLGFQKAMVDLYMEVDSLLEDNSELPPFIKTYYQELTDSDLEELTGSYSDENGNSWELKRENNQLFLDDKRVYVIHGNRLILLRYDKFATIYHFDLDHKTLCLKLLYREHCRGKSSGDD